ncbi:hypothetical protein Leryth_002193 [Lithospermum erythrorhizon]|nr:hypothetical protein Leryth_002193 [Lithospermum erythrorhizon]
MGRRLKIKSNKKTKLKNKEKGANNNGEGSSLRVWQPLVDKLEDGEDLCYVPSAYNSIHRFRVNSSCLSFDILRDNLGLVRSAFPHTVFCVTGTQAVKASSNYIGIFKLSNLSGKRRDLVPAEKDVEDSDMESDSSDSDEDDEESGGPIAPSIQLGKVFHCGGVNRIRAMSQNPHICASWADTGYVQVWDLSSQMNAFTESATAVRNSDRAPSNQAPLVKFKHEDEGFALDWSPHVPGRLVSGDCKNFIHLWEPTSGASWNIDSNPFVGHTASVEDLQWCPSASDPNYFASCSVDGTIAIWDTRSGKSPKGTIKAHEADVNVISWNRFTSNELASGSDDGSFSIWDLRYPKGGNSVLGSYKYHKHPITSIEWSPHEDSALAVTSNNQLTFWDLSIEKDEEEEAEYKAKSSKEQADAPPDVPPQLLFTHCGQKDLKELHWHSQIPGMVISTALDGFNVIIPTNIAN